MCNFNILLKKQPPGACHQNIEKKMVVSLWLYIIIVAQQGVEPSQRVLSTTVDIGESFMTQGSEKITFMSSSYPSCQPTYRS